MVALTIYGSSKYISIRNNSWPLAIFRSITALLNIDITTYLHTGVIKIQIIKIYVTYLLVFGGIDQHDVIF